MTTNQECGDTRPYRDVENSTPRLNIDINNLLEGFKGPQTNSSDLGGLGFPKFDDSLFFVCDNGPNGPTKGNGKEFFGVKEKGKLQSDGNSTFSWKGKDDAELSIKVTKDEKGAEQEHIKITAPDGTVYSVAPDYSLTVTGKNGESQTYKPTSTMALRCGQTHVWYPPEAGFYLDSGRKTTANFRSGGDVMQVKVNEASQVEYSKLGKQASGKLESFGESSGFNAPDGTTMRKEKDGSMTFEVNGATLTLDAAQKKLTVVGKDGKKKEIKLSDPIGDDFSVGGMSGDISKNKKTGELSIELTHQKEGAYRIGINGNKFTYRYLADPNGH
jgi:hypothetical protein